MNPHTIWDFLEGRNESVFDVQSFMELFSEDIDLFDVVYLLGDDIFSSSEDDSDGFNLDSRLMYGDDSSGSDYY